MLNFGNFHATGGILIVKATVPMAQALGKWEIVEV
jgi:hypothetical protein